MHRIENECVGCPPEIGCMGSSCPNRNVVRFYCDKCGEETTLYYYEDEELCANCILEKLEVVKGSDGF